MPNLSNQEKNDLILAYIDNELNEIDTAEIKNYIESNTNAKEKYLKLKETKFFFNSAYEPFNDQFTKLKIYLIT